MSIADEAAQRFLAYLSRMEQLYGGGGPVPPPPPSGPSPITDAKSGVEREPVDPHDQPIPPSAMDQSGPYGPPDEHAPRMSDAQGGIHPLPDGPTIRSAPTYPMDDDQ